MQAAIIAVIVLVAIGVLALLMGLLPSLTLDNELLTQLDAVIALLIRFLDGCRWFFPLDIFVLCFGVMMAVDNWSLISRIVQYIVKLIRG